jgi:UDP-N-acetylglucosamine--N-acetylmuramyl-(pentapeptide) pyrophosphoryl-undecaprenol N-acetylglucosamine transferase
VRLAGGDAHPDSLWLTFESEQSRSLLAGRRVTYVPYVSPRGYLGVLRTLLTVVRELRGQDFDRCVSTGAAVALGVLPWARMRGIPSVYIESVARTDGPSLTGRLVRALRLATTYTQHPQWEGRGWHRHASVLSSYSPRPRTDAAENGRPLKVFVTVGTIHPYRFDSLVDALLDSGAVNDETVWQLGSTARTGLPGTVHELVDPAAFERYCRSADVVVTHGGVGNIMTILDLGIHPVVVPRRAHRTEHVDDHQIQICRLVEEAGIGTVCEAESLTREILTAASRTATGSTA